MSMEQIKDWLNSLEVPFELEEDTSTFKLMWDVEDVTFEIRITLRADKWIHVAVMLLGPDEIPSENKEDLYAFLLRENWMLDDVTYSMDEEGNLYSENDIPKQTNLENFESELNAVVLGLERFFTIVSSRFGIEPGG
ncbi:MAG: YbjN domain-containing protein, partial [Candidatus Hodarchaeota archaeon]